MSVSWNEVPCIGQNGPITGYLLYYTKTTFNDTVNITGGDNRQCILTGLTPYTNYTVTVRAYNDAGIGPTSNETIQQTVESGKYTLIFSITVLLCDLVPGVVSDLQVINVGTDTISISWNISTIPNGIITVYEIRYRDSNNNGLYNITNTTNTQYSIEGLLPNTNYTIEVRAYTSIGPGDWSSIISTSKICKIIIYFVKTLLLYFFSNCIWFFYNSTQYNVSKCYVGIH